MTTDAEIARLHARLQPVMDAARNYAAAELRFAREANSATSRDTVVAYAETKRAAMLIQAQAQADALREVGCSQLRVNGDDCRKAFPYSPLDVELTAIFWCARCVALAAAEALVERLLTAIVQPEQLS